MLQEFIQGLQHNLTTEITQFSNQLFNKAKKKVMYTLLQILVFGAATIFLLLGFILFAANFIALEYVLLLFGAILFLVALVFIK